MRQAKAGHNQALEAHGGFDGVLWILSAFVARIVGSDDSMEPKGGKRVLLGSLHPQKGS